MEDLSYAVQFGAIGCAIYEDATYLPSAVCALPLWLVSDCCCVPYIQCSPAEDSGVSFVTSAKYFTT